MTHARIAEWILSLALPPQRAATILGDLEESTEERGRLWFWSCVIRLMGAKIWQDLSEHPAMAAWLGIRGFIMSARAPAACMLVIFVLPQLTGHGDIRTRHDWGWTLLMRNVARPGAPPDIELQWPVQWTFMLLWTAGIFRTGRAIALRNPRREIAACLAVSLIGWAAVLAAEVLSVTGIVAGRVSPFIVWTGLAHDLTLFAGAIRIRLQHKQSA